jgi:hypothetical protein
MQRKRSLAGSSRDLGLMEAPSQDLAGALRCPYALLMSDEDQDSLGITSENIVTLNRIIFSDGINVENNSRITFAYPGQYLVTARFQFANRGNAEQIFEIWAKNTGVNYPLSNTRFDIPARKSLSIYSHVTANISSIFTVTNEEYLEFAWWSDGADMYIEHYAAGTSPTRPEIASVIVTVTFVSALPARFVPTFQIGFHWLVQPRQWQLGLVFHRGLF